MTHGIVFESAAHQISSGDEGGATDLSQWGLRAHVWQQPATPRSSGARLVNQFMFNCTYGILDIPAYLWHTGYPRLLMAYRISPLTYGIQDIPAYGIQDIPAYLWHTGYPRLWHTGYPRLLMAYRISPLQDIPKYLWPAGYPCVLMAHRISHVLMAYVHSYGSSRKLRDPVVGNWEVRVF